MATNSRTGIFSAAEWLCRIALVAVFLLAAIPKLLDPMTFAKDIANYRVFFPLIGQSYIYPVAMFMPGLELVAALALLFGKWKRAGSLLTAGLLLLFIVLIGQAYARGLNIDCGCFGRAGASIALAQKVGLQKILENTLWLIMALFIFLRSRALRTEEHALWE